MVQQFGRRFTGVLKPQLDLGLTNAGSSYQVDLQTQNLTVENEGAAINQLLSMEQDIADLRILYVETNPDQQNITIQFMDTGPGQFSLSGFLTSLPSYMLFGAILIVGYVLWTFMQPQTLNQWLVVALGAIGAGLVMYLALWGEERLPKPEQAYKRQENLDKKAASANAKFLEKRKGLRSMSAQATAKFSEADSKYTRALGEKQRLETQFNKAKEKDKNTIERLINAKDDEIEQLTAKRTNAENEAIEAQARYNESTESIS
jgi:hypothetical protein